MDMQEIQQVLKGAVGIMTFYPPTPLDDAFSNQLALRMLRVRISMLLLAGLKRIILVDDGTGLFASDEFGNKPVTLITNEINQGKASAVKRALQFALERHHNAETFIQIDYDHDQWEQDVLYGIEVLRQSGADMLMGDRYAPYSQIPSYRRLILRLQEDICQYLGFQGIRDTTAGLQIYNRRFAELLMREGRAKRWGLEVEGIILCALHGLSCQQFDLTKTRLRTTSTKRLKLMEIVQEGILPHTPKLEAADKGGLIHLLRFCYEQGLKQGAYFRVPVELINGSYEMFFWLLPDGLYTLTPFDVEGIYIFHSQGKSSAFDRYNGARCRIHRLKPPDEWADQSVAACVIQFLDGSGQTYGALETELTRVPGDKYYITDDEREVALGLIPQRISKLG